MSLLGYFSHCSALMRQLSREFEGLWHVELCSNSILKFGATVRAQPHSSLGSVGMYSVNEHDVPPMPQKPQGREGGTQQQQHVRAHETREQILEAFSKHSARDALSVHHDPIW